MNSADRDRERPLDESSLFGPRFEPGPRPSRPARARGRREPAPLPERLVRDPGPRGYANPPRGQEYPTRRGDAYPPRGYANPPREQPYPPPREQPYPPPRGQAYAPPRGQAYPPRRDDTLLMPAYPPRRGAAGTRGPGRARRLPVKRLAALAVGGAMVVAGAFAVVVAFNGGPGHQMGGAATQIPSSVGSAPPKLTSVPMADPLPPSEPVRIEIPSLGVNAPLINLGQAADGTVQVPPLDNRNLAGWYDRTVLPGQAGTSVILGHVDNFTGPSVFFNIKLLQPRDIVKVVRADGKTAEFSVDGVQRVSKATFPSSAIYGNTSFPGLRLITCGGPFDSTTRQYLDNIVVYTHLIS